MTRRHANLLAAALVAIAALLVHTAPAAAAVERYAVIIGNDLGDDDEGELQYAEDDASKMQDVLEDLGAFPAENVVMLAGRDATTVRRALIATNDRIRQVIAGGQTQVLLLVYYSGHADAEALHLGPSTLALSEVQQLVRGSPATFRLLVLDSCRSGTVTRSKGGTAAPAFVIDVDEQLAGEGAVFLTSSSASEDSQESDELKGSFFTHYLVSGLLGAADVNGDGAVALEEAYRYAYDNTLRASSRTLAGTQHPSFHYDVRGQGGIVLTTLVAGASKRATVELPAGRTYLLFDGSAEGAVVAEVSSTHEVRRLSVRPGRYFVRGRDRDHLLEGIVRVAAGETHPVVDDELERIDYARLVRKGGGSVLRLVHGPLAGYRVRSALWPGTSPCHGPFVGYAVALPGFTVGGRLDACRGGFANQTLSADADELGLEARVAHAWDFAPATVELGLVGGIAILQQRFTTEGIAPTRTTAAVQLGVTAGITRDLGGGFYLGGDLTTSTYLFTADDSADGHSGSSIHDRFTVGGALHIGKLW